MIQCILFFKIKKESDEKYEILILYQNTKLSINYNRINMKIN